MEARGIAKHPAMHTTAPDKEVSSPNVSSIKVKECSSTGMYFILNICLKTLQLEITEVLSQPLKEIRLKENCFIKSRELECKVAILKCLLFS